MFKKWDYKFSEDAEYIIEVTELKLFSSWIIQDQADSYNM